MRGTKKSKLNPFVLSLHIFPSKLHHRRKSFHVISSREKTKQQVETYSDRKEQYKAYSNLKEL